MKIRLSGRTKESAEAIQGLADFLQRFGEMKENQENIFIVDNRETVLVAFSSQSYFDRKGYYWFSLAKTKSAQMLKWSEEHAWMVLICGIHGRYFVPIGQIKPLLEKMPSNKHDGRWDLYIRLESDQAYFDVTELKNRLDVTERFQHFEQIWGRPAIEEVYVADHEMEEIRLSNVSMEG